MLCIYSAVGKLKLWSVKKEGVPSRFNLTIPGRANICPGFPLFSCLAGSFAKSHDKVDNPACSALKYSPSSLLYVDYRAEEAFQSPT